MEIHFIAEVDFFTKRIFTFSIEYIGIEEIEQSLDKEVVRRLLKLITFRNEYPAFNGEFSVLNSANDQIILSWKMGEKYCRLSIDLKPYISVINRLSGFLHNSLFYSENCE